MKEMTGEELIVVTRHKIDHKVGRVKFENLGGFRWDTTSGGANVYAGTIGLYAYMTCTDLEDGEIGHSGIHGKCPHDIKVYIPKGPNKKYYRFLAEEAGPKPENPNKKALGTTERVRKIVEEKPGITAVEVADILEKDGVRRKTVKNSIRYLKRIETKNKTKLRSERYKNTQKLYIE